VILQFDNGISGYGESAPRIYVTGESLATVVQVIQNNFARILFHTEVDSVEDIANILRRLEEECSIRISQLITQPLGQ